MRSLQIIILGLLFMGKSISAQVGIGTSSPSATAKLEVSSTTKGVLFPRMTNAQMLAIVSPVQGLQVYNTNANCMYYYNGQQWLSTLNAISVLADAGDVVQLDNFKVRFSTSGNRSMEISTVSGSITVSGSSFNLYTSSNVGSTGGIGSESGLSFSSTTVGTSWMYLQSAANFTQNSNVQRLLINDQTNNKCYRVTCIIGSGYLNNTIEIERVY
jgi:hypothetical protein